MSTVTVCDRCGKQGTDRGWMRVTIYHLRLGRGETKRDLCGTCGDDLDRFLATGPSLAGGRP